MTFAHLDELWTNTWNAVDDALHSGTQVEGLEHAIAKAAG